MKTQLLPASAPDTAAIAAKLLREGELVALPTETFYGLGADVYERQDTGSPGDAQTDAPPEGQSLNYDADTVPETPVTATTPMVFVEGAVAVGKDA